MSIVNVLSVREQLNERSSPLLRCALAIEVFCVALILAARFIAGVSPFRFVVRFAFSITTVYDIWRAQLSSRCPRLPYYRWRENGPEKPPGLMVLSTNELEGEVRRWSFLFFSLLFQYKNIAILPSLG